MTRECKKRLEHEQETLLGCMSELNPTDVEYNQLKEHLVDLSDIDKGYLKESNELKKALITAGVTVLGTVVLKHFLDDKLLNNLKLFEKENIVRSLAGKIIVDKAFKKAA